MSSSTGTILIRQIRKTYFFHKKPENELVQAVENYIPRAEVGMFHNHERGQGQTLRNYLYVRRFKSYVEGEGWKERE